MATGEILRLKCMTMEGLVSVVPGFKAVFPECDYLTRPASSLFSGGGIDVAPLIECTLFDGLPISVDHQPNSN
jgi:hypothetical protein